MGLRDRFKKRVANAIRRDSPTQEPPQRAAPKPPPPSKRPRASYRTHSAAPATPEPSPKLQAEPIQAEPIQAEPLKHEAEVAAQQPPTPSPSAPDPAAPLPVDETPMEKREIDTEISYTVRLFNKAEGLDTEIQVFDGEFVLDAADRCAVDLPSSCRNGGCTVCAGRLISGTMEMEDQYVLEEEHIEDGFQLLCCGVLTSDAVIETHQDEVVA